MKKGKKKALSLKVLADWIKAVTKNKTQSSLSLYKKMEEKSMRKDTEVRDEVRTHLNGLLTELGLVESYPEHSDIECSSAKIVLFDNQGLSNNQRVIQKIYENVSDLVVELIELAKGGQENE